MSLAVGTSRWPRSNAESAALELHRQAATEGPWELRREGGGEGGGEGEEGDRTHAGERMGLGKGRRSLQKETLTGPSSEAFYPEASEAGPVEPSPASGVPPRGLHGLARARGSSVKAAGPEAGHGIPPSAVAAVLGQELTHSRGLAVLPGAQAKGVSCTGLWLTRCRRSGSPPGHPPHLARRSSAAHASLTAHCTVKFTPILQMGRQSLSKRMSNSAQTQGPATLTHANILKHAVPLHWEIAKPVIKVIAILAEVQELGFDHTSSLVPRTRPS